MWKMGGRLFLMASLFCTLAIACAGLEAKRGVAGNVFFSSSKPKLNIEIASDFNPLDEKSTSGSQFFADSAGSTNIEKEIYRFINRADKREISIQFHRISANRVYWKAIDFKGIKTAIESGVESHNGDAYKYCVYTFANDNGCFLVKILGRRIGGQSDTKMLLYYLEWLGPSGNFSKWRNTALLTRKQKKRVAEFQEAFKEDVKIVDYVEVHA